MVLYNKGLDCHWTRGDVHQMGAILIKAQVGRKPRKHRIASIAIFRINIK